MKKVFFLLLVLSINVNAQRKQDDMPSFLNNLNIQQVPTSHFSIISNHEIKNTFFNDGTPAYGKTFDANLNFKNVCRLDSVSEYEGVFRLAVKSDSATSIDIVIDSLTLEDEDEIWFYNQTQTQIFGPYNRFSPNYKKNKLYSPTIYGDKLYIEYFGGLSSNNSMKISIVSHLVTSNSMASVTSDCLENIKCSIAENWQNEARSIVKIRLETSSFIRWGSGVMINWVYDSNSNYKPYLLTAFHVLDRSGDGILNEEEQELINYRFYFDFDPADCADDNPWLMNEKFVAGATIKTANYPNDLALIQLDSKPSTNWNVYLAGFTISPDLPTSGACIHSPSRKDQVNNGTGTYMVRNKKISLSSNASSNDIFQNFSSPFGSTMLNIKFALSSLPAGSSGAPFFNQNKQVCGILSYGGTNCYSFSVIITAPNGSTFLSYYGPNEPTAFGKLSECYNLTTDFNGDGITEKMSTFLSPGVLN